MVSIHTCFEKIDNKAIVEPLINLMTEHFEDFAAVQESFKETISQMASQRGEEGEPSVSDEVDAIYQQIASGLLFSCFLGMKANYDHFVDPISNAFLDADPETYLQEKAARQLPEYRSAQITHKQFYAALSPLQKEKYEAIAEYISYLETAGPKLAHYYGYLMGNQLFPRVIAGYVADEKLTIRYRNALAGYFGTDIVQGCDHVGTAVVDRGAQLA